jgi:hypothetical protein
MVREILQEISELLEKHNGSSNPMAIALLGDENKLWDFLVSNELWGGAGSVADQALLELPEERRRLEGLMIRLGREQMRLGKVNIRTEMWVFAFEKWLADKASSPTP